MKQTKIIQYVFPYAKAWIVKASNRKKPSHISVNKSEAVRFAKTKAKTTRSAVVIYGKKGQILSRISYRTLAKA